MNFLFPFKEVALSNGFNLLLECEEMILSLNEDNIESICNFIQNHINEIGHQTIYRLITSIYLTHPEMLDVIMDLLEIYDETGDFAVKFATFVLSFFSQYQFLTNEFINFDALIQKFIEFEIVNENLLNSINIPAKYLNIKPTELEECVMKDDIDKLQILYFENPSMKLDEVKTFDDICSRRIQRPKNLIECAAFYGSVKCYIYLQMNGCGLTNDLMRFAVHGRNIDIIHQVEIEIENLHKDIMSDYYAGTHNIAAYMHSNEILEWIIETKGQTINFENEIFLFLNQIFCSGSFLAMKRLFLLIDLKIQETNESYQKYLKSLIISCISIYGNKVLLDFLFENYFNEIIIQSIYHICIDLKNSYDACFSNEFNFIKEENTHFIDILFEHLNTNINQSYPYYSNQDFYENLDIVIKNRGALSIMNYYFYTPQETIYDTEFDEKLASNRMLTPLAFAIVSYPLKYVKYFMNQKGIDINCDKCSKNNTALHMACMEKKIKCIKILLNEPKIDINIMNSEGDTPLSLIFKRLWINEIHKNKFCENTYKEQIEEIFEIFTNDKRISYEGIQYQTVLFCLKHNYPEIAKKIFKKYPNIKYDYPNYLQYCLKNCNYHFASLLLKQNNFDIEKHFPDILFQSISSNNLKLSLVLLDSPNININQFYYDDSNVHLTPLMIACKMSNEPLVKKMLDHPKINIHSKNEEKKTAFDYASNRIKTLFNKTK
ncbi:hypothetical protein TRFO_37605 [Tritrichomonas foetus]|uniref:Uncharacterized protein n=1 Tax=Tritrichomonas foetus TaxID=1144522 RepID=A0A1J4JAR8_9EUKA|nr:hypothetical protein TRFO_37605 [Tritrichomonas foetus]|eukprot:OHS96248.1 hypothetical protein TRFO_37605 [Tritrichomonas foetus]